MTRQEQIKLTAAAITGICSNPVLIQLAMQKYGSAILDPNNMHVEKEIASMAVKVANEAGNLINNQTYCGSNGV